LEKVLSKGEGRQREEDIPGKMKKGGIALDRRGSANLRHRANRCDNRHGKKGWMPQSLMILVEGISNIAERFRKLATLTSTRMERARFETGSQTNPQIPGIEYQRGDFSGLSGYPEYLPQEKFLK
jgi:hypothetical protein